ncbi:MAG: type II secretion system protein N [Phycisphaerales bacterium]|jgi:type II secretion system protein C
MVLCIVIVKTIIIPQHPGGIFTPVTAAGTENVPGNGIGNSTEATAKDYSDIVKQNIFGGMDLSHMKDSQSNISDNTISLAEEELGLELVGTISGNATVSRALIQDTKTRQLGLYKTGQNIANAHINSIEDNAVILLHDGRRKMLTLKRGGKQNRTDIQTLPSKTTNQINKATRPILRGNNPPATIPTRAKHMAEILSKAVFEPYIVNDQVEGLKITGLEKIPVPKMFGLKNGDVILEVNGNRLTSKQKALQVFKKAKAQEAINLELFRNGETKELLLTLH